MDQENPVPLKLTCEDVIGMLLEYLETRLDTPTLAAFERHLAVCPPCIAYLNTYRRTRDMTGTSGRVEMPDEMKTRIRDFLLTQLRAGTDPA
jgi:anti-sigma factor RsiW